MTRIETSAEPAAGELEAVQAVLAAANAESGYPHLRETILLTLRDEAGAVQGGLIGRVFWHWIYVETLALPPALRGQDQGSRLLAMAEAEARARGCVGVRLDTYSFQARGFYEKQGYRIAGAIEDCPPGHTRFTMVKRLDRQAEGDAHVPT